MRQVLFILFFLFIFGLSEHASAASTELIRTPVQVTTFKSERNRQIMEAVVQGAAINTRLVILLKSVRRSGFQVATNISGEPVLPTVMEELPPADYSIRKSIESHWSIEFVPPKSQKISEVYVVVCEVRNRSGSSPESDYDKFKYLPFEDSLNIDDAFELLRNFGWAPTGFTKIAP